MKVYYDASIWERQSSHKINEKPGIKQWVNWRFNYLGKEYGELGSYKVIPALEKHNAVINSAMLQSAINDMKNEKEKLNERINSN